MGVFLDRVLIRLSDPDALEELIAPAADSPTAQAQLRILLGAMYEWPFATLHEVRNVEVRRIEVQRPLFAPELTRGTWTQTIPSHTRTDVVYSESDGREPEWLDIFAELRVTLLLEIDPGEVESVLMRHVPEFNTLAEFRSHFRFIDLDDFMARHSITSVDELRERLRYLIAEIRGRAPGPFNPNDPGNEHPFTLNLAILIRESVDVAAGMREAKLAKEAVERSVTYKRELDAAEVRTPYAPAVIFPEDALNGSPLGAAAIRELYSRERILALFVTSA